MVVVYTYLETVNSIERWWKVFLSTKVDQSLEQKAMKFAMARIILHFRLNC